MRARLICGALCFGLGLGPAVTLMAADALNAEAEAVLVLRGADRQEFAPAMHWMLFHEAGGDLKPEQREAISTRLKRKLEATANKERASRDADLKALTREMVSQWQVHQDEHGLITDVVLKVDEEGNVVARAARSTLMQPEVPVGVRNILLSASQISIADALNHSGRYYTPLVSSIAKAAVAKFKMDNADDFGKFTQAFAAAKTLQDKGNVLAKQRALQDIAASYTESAGREVLGNEVFAQLLTTVDLQTLPSTDAALASFIKKANSNSAQIARHQDELTKLQRDVETGAASFQQQHDRVVKALTDAQKLAADAQNAAKAIGSIDSWASGVKAVSALEGSLLNPNFLARLPPQWRAEAISKTALALGAAGDVQKLADAFSKSTSFEGASNALKGGVRIAATLGSLGVLDQAQADSVKQAVTTAQAGIQLAASISSQNPLGAIDAVSSLLGGGSIFGGGGGDDDPAEKARHEEEMRELHSIRVQLGQLQEGIEHVSVQVDQVLALQGETLEKLSHLQDLQEQTLVHLNKIEQTVLSARDDLLQELRVLEQKVDAVNRTIRYKSHNDNYQKCLNFMAGAHLKEAGNFASYKERREHFNANLPLFRGCVDEFYANLWGAQVAVTPFELLHVGAVPREGETILPADSALHAYENVFAPMMQLTRLALRPDAHPKDALPDACAARLIAALSGAPQELGHLSLSRLQCYGDRGVFGLYKNYKGDAVGLPDVVLAQPLNVSRALIFADQLAFFSSYKSLSDKIEVEAELPSEALLANANTYKPSGSNAEWLRQYTDALNVAVAQQALYAGLAVADWAAERLERNKFGWDPRSGTPQHNLAFDALIQERDWAKDWKRDEKKKTLLHTAILDCWAKDQGKWEGGQCSPRPIEIAKVKTILTSDQGQLTDASGRLPCKLPPGQFGEGFADAFLMCLMKQNALLRENVLNAAVSRALGARSRENYARAYLSQNDKLWKSVLGSWWTVVWREQGATPFATEAGWYVQMRDEAGDFYEAPLPAPFWVEHQVAAYSPQLDQLRACQQLNFQRIVFFTAGPDNAKIRPLLNKVALTMDSPLRLKGAGGCAPRQRIR